MPPDTTRQTLARLRRLTGRRLQQSVFAALEAGARRVRDDARANLADVSDTGELAASLQVDSDPDNMTVTVSATAPHAAAVEFGASKIEERPFLRPALERNRAAIRRDIAAAIKKTLNRP